MADVPGMVPICEEVTIKTADGHKFKARVIEKKVYVDPVDVTMGGLFPGGPSPDPYRKSVPGRTTVTLTLELGEVIRPKEPKPRCTSQHFSMRYVTCLRKDGHEGWHRNGGIRWGAER